MIPLAQRIRRSRTRAGLSQTALALRIGIKRSAVTQWEHPHGTKPSVEHLIRIAVETNTGFEWLATGRAAFASFEQLPGPRTALLVGGPTGHAPWREDDIAPLLGELAARIRSNGGSVLATTSRRTPRAVTQALLRAFDDVPGVIWSDGGDGSNPYAGLLGWAERIVCTPDSVNLLSEAYATRVPVGVLLGRCAQGRMARFQQSLRERGRLLDGLDALAEDATPAIEPLRETPRIAAEVKARLGL